MGLLASACGGDSATGDAIVFSSDRDGGLELYIRGTETGQEVRLTHNNFFDGHPDWSPDGSRIVFTSTGDSDPEIGADGFELYTMAADGSDIFRLTNDEVYQGAADWSPDGSMLVFDGDDPAGTLQVFTMTVDSPGPPTQLTSGSIHGLPAWSADGTRIAYISIENGAQEISVMDADGSHQVNLTSNNAVDVLPAWSPDGSQISFVSDRDGNWEIYLMDADGANPKRLTDDPGEDADPAWSPDGSRVLFRSDRGGQPDIYSMDTDGAGLRRETDDPAVDLFPDWTDSRDSDLTVLTTVASTPGAQGVPVYLVSSIENVTDATAYRYRLADDRGLEMDTVKIIEVADAGGFVGVYHSFSSTGGFTVSLATSIDLMRWTWRTDLADRASMPTIAAASDGGFVVAWEQEPRNHLRLAYYPSWNDLVNAAPSKTFDPPRRLSSCAEGTPSLNAASSSFVDVGFHYHAGCELDSEARGTTNWKTWTVSRQPQLDATVRRAGVAGGIGDRDSIVIDGDRFTFIEGQTALGDWSTWRVYVLEGPGGVATPLDIRTHAGSTAFTNPTVAIVSIAGRPAILVTLFVPQEGAKGAEAGELVYYRFLDE